MKYLPDNKPQISKAEAEKIVKAKLGETPKFVLIGIRGYYSKSMGSTPGNDINLYDDAMVAVGPDTFSTWNANTDPSFVKKGGRELAKLNTGVYEFYKGKHRGKYNALRAYPEGVVWNCTRDGKPATCSYINIHKGGITPSTAGVTWSEGCQTIPAPQYADFIETVYYKMLKLEMKTVKYILIDVTEMNSILNG